MFYIKIIISGTHWFRHNWNLTPGSVKKNSHNHQSNDQDITNETEKADVSDLTEDHVDGLFACPEQSCRKVYSRPHLL